MLAKGTGNKIFYSLGNVGINQSDPNAFLYVSSGSSSQSNFITQRDITGITSAKLEFASDDPNNSDWSLRLANSTALTWPAAAPPTLNSHVLSASPTGILSWTRMGSNTGGVSFSQIEINCLLSNNNLPSR